MKEQPWLRWSKDEQAVSPVIAVILMVAITVVLAAVVYTWASGLAGTGGGGIQQGTCSNTGNNRLRVSEGPGQSVPHGDAVLRAIDSNGDVWTGEDNPDPTDWPRDTWGFNWTGTQGSAIQSGDLIVVSSEPYDEATKADQWDNSERLDFEILFEGDTVLACPYTWVE